MDGNNPFLNGGFALGGGLGSMPVSAPFSMGGVGPGALFQNGGSGVPGIFGAALPSGLRQDMLNMLPYAAAAGGGIGAGAGAMAMQPKPDETPQQTQQPSMENSMTAADQAKGQMDAYKMMAQGVQNMGRGMQMQMPSGNTAQIMRDQNQFRFAGTPQQQMANALRNR